MYCIIALFRIYESNSGSSSGSVENENTGDKIDFGRKEECLTTYYDVLRCILYKNGRHRLLHERVHMNTKKGLWTKLLLLIYYIQYLVLLRSTYSERR